MSDTTDTKWPNATASWDEPNPVVKEDYITAETTNGYINTLVSRDMYLLNEMEEALDEIRQSITDGDEALSESISDLKSDMESADTTLQNNIDAAKTEVTNLVTDLRTDMEKTDNELWEAIENVDVEAITTEQIDEIADEVFN